MHDIIWRACITDSRPQFQVLTDVSGSSGKKPVPIERHYLGHPNPTIGTLKVLERGDSASAHLEMTQSWMITEVASLSSAQFNFRPTPDRWNIAEVVQHVAIAEPNYWKLLNDGLKQPPRKQPKQASDADVLWYGIDRTRHEDGGGRKSERPEN